MQNIEFGIDCDSRVALVGPNGAGTILMHYLRLSLCLPPLLDFEGMLWMVICMSLLLPLPLLQCTTQCNGCLYNVQFRGVEGGDSNFQHQACTASLSSLPGLMVHGVISKGNFSEPCTGIVLMYCI